MKKELKDYLHLYLGCECMFEGSLYKLVGIVTDMPAEEEQDYNVRLYNDHLGFEFSSYEDVKPILRPLSDMTEEEAKVGRLMFDKMNEDEKLLGEIEGERTRYLLSKHFDLFGLIDAGIAIDKTNIL